MAIMSSNVPKFASFRPKPKPALESPQQPTTPAVKAKDRSKNKIPRERPESHAPESSKIERDASFSKLYFSDRRGDQDILKYGALNRYDIPAYRRAGYGHVLGLSLEQKIDRERSSHSKVYMIPTTRQRQERLLTGKHVPREGSRTLRIVQSKDKQTIEDGHDFIAVSATRQKRRGDGDDDAEAESGKEDLDYRGIERDHSQPLDPNTQYDDEIEDDAHVSELTKKNSELVRKTRESPGEMQVWLDFIKHQEAMMSLDRTMLELGDAARRQLADLRIPIYEEALKKVLSDPDAYVQLHKGLLTEAQKLWTDAKLSKRWTEVLALYPASIDLWLMYLNFVQSNFARFKYESCRATFLTCLEVLQPSKTVAVESILHIFIRLTAMIQGAGYQELALAIWQAVLEFSLSPPTSTVELETFEGSWEVDAPRIGEVGARGWREVTAITAEEEKSKDISLQPQDPSNSVFEDFRKRELDTIEKLRYPGRITEDDGEDDAFHTIFFVDIEPYLDVARLGGSIVLVLEAFLCFCGLPALPQVSSHQRAWYSDPFLSHSGTCTPSQHDEDPSPDSFGHKLERLLACDVKSLRMTSDLLFDHDFSLDRIRLSPDFVRRVLKLISTESGDEALGEYLLAFEYRHFPADVVKTAKQLLKARPSSQRLYHAYGLVESHRGKSDKANQVFSMALSMGTPGNYESLQLLHSWVWEALKCDDPIEALWRLTSPTGKLPARVNPMLPPDSRTLDTASIHLSETCEKALLGQDYPSAVISTSLIALLTYLRSNHNPESALAAHKGLVDWFTSHRLSTSPYAELNAQDVARFLTYHITHAPIVKPRSIRSALEPFISLFPNNTILLALYAANEARFAIDDRVRGIMQHSALQGSGVRTVSGWSFAIHFETLRGEIAGSTSHSIRALYRRATHPDSSGAHSPLIWSSYLAFELEQLYSERARTRGKTMGQDGKKKGWEKRLEEAESRVKETFYAGLRALPWCKDFYMQAFDEGIRDVLEEEGMKKVYGVMGEKELRVYVEVD
jgi:hypothetical protein